MASAGGAASLKSFKPREGDPPTRDGDPGNPSVDFHEEQRPQRHPFRAKKSKGAAAKLASMAHVLMEHGLLLDFVLTRGTGTGGARCGFGDAGLRLSLISVTHKTILICS